MKKIHVLLVAASLFIAASLPPVLAVPETVQTCPVSGDVLKNNQFAYDYKGKTYHFCCNGAHENSKKILPNMLTYWRSKF